MLLGSVSEEGNQMHSRPTEEEWHASLAKTYGEDKATAVVAALKKAYPHKQIQTLSYMCSGSFGLNGLAMRNNIVKMARLKHEQKACACLRLLLHLAIADAGWRCRGMAHRRAAILLR